MNPDIINKVAPKTKISGVNFDIRTGFDVVLNFFVKLMVWKEDGSVEEARGMYINFSVKNFFGADFFQNSLVFKPTPGLFKVKIFDKKGEAIEDETN